LLGNLPELDSLAIVELIVALQNWFGIEIKDDEIVGDIFESLGRLAAFVRGKVRWVERQSASSAGDEVYGGHRRWTGSGRQQGPRAAGALGPPRGGDGA
jgi:hypothetical protein